MLHDNNSSRRGCDRMVVGFTTNYAISTYHHLCCEFESRSWRDVLDSTLCDKFVSDFTTGRWFSPGIPVSPRQICALQASLTLPLLIEVFQQTTKMSCHAWLCFMVSILSLLYEIFKTLKYFPSFPIPIKTSVV